MVHPYKSVYRHVSLFLYFLENYLEFFHSETFIWKKTVQILTQKFFNKIGSIEKKLWLPKVKKNFQKKFLAFSSDALIKMTIASKLLNQMSSLDIQNIRIEIPQSMLPDETKKIFRWGAVAVLRMSVYRHAYRIEG